MASLTVEQCRAILGDTCSTDAQIEATRDELERVANGIFDEMAKRKIEEMRWAAYGQQNPEDAL